MHISYRLGICDACCEIEHHDTVEHGVPANLSGKQAPLQVFKPVMRIILKQKRILGLFNTGNESLRVSLELTVMLENVKRNLFGGCLGIVRA